MVYTKRTKRREHDMFMLVLAVTLFVSSAAIATELLQYFMDGFTRVIIIIMLIASLAVFLRKY